MLVSWDWFKVWNENLQIVVVGYKTGLIKDHPVLYQYFIAVLSAKTTHKLVVAQMTKAAIRVADPALWTVFAIGFNQYMGTYIDQNLLFYVLVGKVFY